MVVVVVGCGVVWWDHQRMTNLLAASLMPAAANRDLIYVLRVSPVQHSHIKVL